MTDNEDRKTLHVKSLPVRWKQDDLDLVRKAARIETRSVSSFIRHHAIAAARRLTQSGEFGSLSYGAGQQADGREAGDPHRVGGRAPARPLPNSERE